MHVHVELPEELDVEAYRLRNARGEVPDHTPYSLHRLGDEGDVVTFRRPARGLTDWAARKVRDQMDGHEALTALSSARQRHGADAIFCMDERTGLPAVYTTRRPVITGVAWLERPERLEGIHRRSAERGLSRAAGIFTQSPAMLPILREHWDVDPGRVHPVRLGIDPEFYAEQPWGDRDPGGATVTSVGDDRARDHATLIDAVTRVRAQGLPAWLELATTLHVDLPPEAGVLHARRMNAAMRGLYQRSSLVAIALRPNPQGSGLTVALEALASGRPVVATDNPGMDTYVEHGRTGLLVPPGDPEAMASAIGELLADPEKAAEMGRAGRKDVEARFTSAHMVADLRDILRGVL